MYIASILDLSILIGNANLISKYACSYIGVLHGHIKMDLWYTVKVDLFTL